MNNRFFTWAGSPLQGRQHICPGPHPPPPQPRPTSCARCARSPTLGNLRSRLRGCRFSVNIFINIKY